MDALPGGAAIAASAASFSACHFKNAWNRAGSVAIARMWRIEVGDSWDWEWTVGSAEISRIEMDNGGSGPPPLPTPPGPGRAVWPDTYLVTREDMVSMIARSRDSAFTVESFATNALPLSRLFVLHRDKWCSPPLGTQARTAGKQKAAVAAFLEECPATSLTKHMYDRFWAWMAGSELEAVGDFQWQERWCRALVVCGLVALSTRAPLAAVTSLELAISYLVESIHKVCRGDIERFCRGVLACSPSVSGVRLMLASARRLSPSAGAGAKAASRRDMAFLCRVDVQRDQAVFQRKRHRCSGPEPAGFGESDLEPLESPSTPPLAPSAQACPTHGLV